VQCTTAFGRFACPTYNRRNAVAPVEPKLTGRELYATGPAGSEFHVVRLSRAALSIARLRTPAR